MGSKGHRRGENTRVPSGPAPAPPRRQTCRPQTFCGYGVEKARPGPWRVLEDEATGTGTESPLGPGPGRDWARGPSIAQGRGRRWRRAGGVVRHRCVPRFVPGEGEGQEASAAAGPGVEGGRWAQTSGAGDRAERSNPKERGAVVVSQSGPKAMANGLYALGCPTGKH